MIMSPELESKRLADANKASKKLKGSILVDYENGAMLVRLTASTPESEKLISPMLNIMKEGLSMQFKMMFGMDVISSKGTIARDKQEIDHK
jgi:hypothetical protein